MADTSSSAFLNGHPLAADLRHVLDQTTGLWEPLRGKRWFLTGGTGFFGCWLLESFLAANDAHNLQASVVVLTRDPEAFARKAPRLAGHAAVTLHAGDVRGFSFPPGGFYGVIHAAAEVDVRGTRRPPREIFDNTLEGTRRVLGFALTARVQRFLFTSSGAMYGRQPPELSHVPEDFSGAPDPLDAAGSAYGEGKRAGEFLCAAASREHPALACVIARAFAFVGPYLPLDGAYAAGNFLRDALAGGPIRVGGDGRPVRSYLYAADLAVWLWTLFFRGAAGRAYNVGSEAALSVGELAAAVACAADLGLEAVKIAASPSSGPAPRYVPATDRAREELELRENIKLDDALIRTLAFLRGVLR